MLTDHSIKAAKPAPKARKLFDERGLYLLVQPNGSKLWRLKYRFEGRECLLALGAYPEVTLKQAREDRDDARRKLTRGINPAAERREQKLAHAETFAALADEWFGKQTTLSADTVSADKARLKKYVMPTIGKRPVNAIKAADVLMALRRIEARGTHDTAHRTRSIVGRVLRYAVATGRAERDISADLKGALQPVRTEGFAAILEPKRLGELLRAIDGYSNCQPTVHAALKLLPLVFVRPGELRFAEWREFENLDGAEPLWRIPGERMKMGKAHLVPLARQAVAILKELQPHSGDGMFLFPGLRSNTRPISDAAINAAMRSMGFSGDEVTGHGFRKTASTLLNETGWNPDLIELQLAHASDSVRAIYNKSQRISERRQMLQAWADYLDGLKADTGGGVVVSLRRA